MIAHFTAGCVLGLLNIFLIQFSWKRILEKKSVVLPALVIVFKYTIFMLIIGVSLTHPEILRVGSQTEMISFLAGWGSTLVVAIILNKTKIFEKV